MKTPIAVLFLALAAAFSGAVQATPLEDVHGVPVSRLEFGSLKLEGALTLILVGLGLTLPVWLMLFKPEWGVAWQRRFSYSPGLRRAQIAFQFAGAAILTAVGLAFMFVHGFHRPLLELVR